MEAKTKKITIETSRITTEARIIDGWQRPKLDILELGIMPFRSIGSNITFSEPILDLKDRPYTELFLYTTMFNPNSEVYWESWLKRKDGTLITQGSSFGKLSDRISGYNERKLEEWFNEAAEAHSSYLEQIEEKYLNNQRLNCDLF